MDPSTTCMPPSHNRSVEACTDPDGGGVQIDPRNATNWNEVADVCNSTAFLGGIKVQSYWSQVDQACVIPYFYRSRPRQYPPNSTAMQITAVRKAFSELNVEFLVEVLAKAPNGDMYQFYRGDVVDLILNKGCNFFVIGSDGVRADVEVLSTETHYYIATKPDASTANNLLSLPVF